MEVVHCAAGRNAYCPEPNHAGIILHGGLNAAAYYLYGIFFRVETVQHLGEKFGFLVVFRLQQRSEIADVGGDTVELRFRKHFYHLFHGFLTILSVHNHLGKHRVVKGSDFYVLAKISFHSCFLRKFHFVDFAAGGTEIVKTVFRINTAFQCMSFRFAKKGF